MRLKSHWFLIIALAAVLSWAGWKSHAQSTTKNIWEYKIVPYSGNLPQIEFAKLGAEGWELVTITTAEEIQGNLRSLKYSYYFKRPR